MRLGIFYLELMRKLIFMLVLLCVLVSLKNQNAELKDGSQTLAWVQPSFHSSNTLLSPFDFPEPIRMDRSLEEDQRRGSLEYDYYRDSCPEAEGIVRRVVWRQQEVQPEIAPALLRLLFHDCFIQGCDASVLLDAVNGSESEKDVPPNETLKGFDVIDIIKSEIEDACPGVVSCADILVLAAREAVVLVGGPFYPLLTGRRDSTISFPELANYEIPNPQDDLPAILSSFGSRGFNEQETVTLLGAHSAGMIHCRFFKHRLYNFQNTDQPDPSIDPEFLNLMRSICRNSDPPSASPSIYVAPAQSSSSSERSSDGIKMDYEGPGSAFGTLYYQGLLRNRGILYADQQLIAGEETKTWVMAYAYSSNSLMFRKYFAMAMMKLSNLSVLDAPMGQIRLHCAKVV